MNEQKNIKNYIFSDEYLNNSDSESNIEDSINSFDEIEEYEYTQDTINIIHSSLINYVSDNSLTLCEYLDIIDIENFLSF
jgi:hypothetical protein